MRGTVENDWLWQDLVLNLVPRGTKLNLVYSRKKVKPFTFVRGTAQRHGSERLFLREKRLSNAQGRGLCEANAGHAPRGMVCWGREPGVGRRSQVAGSPGSLSYTNVAYCSKNRYKGTGTAVPGTRGVQYLAKVICWLESCWKFKNTEHLRTNGFRWRCRFTFCEHACKRVCRAMT
jgi:hypothetical protein